MTEKENEEAKQRLFDFWKEIPVIKKFSDSNPFADSLVRMYIPKILQVGVKEEYPPNSGKVRTRRALSVREIRDRLNENIKTRMNIEKEFKLANIYFHLEKLEEAGIVKEIASITSGRRKSTAYFGLTAKLYIFLEDTLSFRNKNLIDFMIKNIPKLNTNIPEEKIRQVLNRTIMGSDKINNVLQTWFEKYNDKLVDHEIDFTMMYIYLEHMLTLNHELVDLFSEYLKLLNLS